MLCSAGRWESLRMSLFRGKVLHFVVVLWLKDVMLVFYVTKVTIKALAK
jgi:hypothetical protein